MTENPFKFDDEDQADNDTRCILHNQYMFNTAIPAAYAKPIEPKKHTWGSNGVCIECHLTITEYNNLKPIFRDWGCGTLHRLCMRIRYCKQCGLSEQYIKQHWPETLRCVGIIEITESAPELYLY